MKNSGEILEVYQKKLEEIESFYHRIFSKSDTCLSYTQVILEELRRIVSTLEEDTRQSVLLRLSKKDEQTFISDRIKSRLVQYQQFESLHNPSLDVKPKRDNESLSSLSSIKNRGK